MNVPFLDLGQTYQAIQPEVEEAILSSLRSGQYIGGPGVELFEAQFANYVGAAFCTGVANGLDALHLALRAMNVGSGDQVIVPSHTYIATWLAVTQCGATPVPVECTPETFSLDPGRVEAAITPRTRAVIAVHLYGHPADLDPILFICRNHNLRLLEDAAQAHGARYKGARIGTHGDAVAWSFYPGKNLGALGDAGAVTTRHADLAQSLQSLRNYGSRIKYINEVAGFNSRLDPVQAAALSVKLRHLDTWNARRRQIAEYYLSRFDRYPKIVLPITADWGEHVWHLFVVRHRQRDELAAALTSDGVNTLIHYPVPPHLQGAYASMGLKQGSFPIAEMLAREVLSLPLSPMLSDGEVEYVVEVMDKHLRRLE